MQLEPRNEIENALAGLTHIEKAALLITMLLKGSEADTSDAVCDLLTCATTMAAHIDDPLIRHFVVRRLRHSADDIEARATEVLH